MCPSIGDLQLAPLARYASAQNSQHTLCRPKRLRDEVTLAIVTTNRPVQVQDSQILATTTLVRNNSSAAMAQGYTEQDPMSDSHEYADIRWECYAYVLGDLAATSANDGRDPFDTQSLVSSLSVLRA